MFLSDIQDGFHGSCLFKFFLKFSNDISNHMCWIELKLGRFIVAINEDSESHDQSHPGERFWQTWASSQ